MIKIIKQTLKNISALALFAGALGACDILAPVSMTLVSQKTFEMKANGGGWVALGEGQTTHPVVDYKSFGNKLTLDFGPQGVVTFKKVKVDERAGTLVSLAEKSDQTTKTGEKLGLTARKTPRCEPECSHSESSRSTETCTYYERRSFTRCGTDYSGHTTCWIEWQDVPVYGWQLVETIRTDYFYNLSGEIAGVSSGSLAVANAQFTEHSVERRALTTCR